MSTMHKTWDNVRVVESADKNVKKYVYTNPDAVAEAVLYKYPTYKERTVICCSTQSGCPVGCRFCGAGDHFVRSLTAEEIWAQPMSLLYSEIDCTPEEIQKLQIMFMSMGEPLLNYPRVKEAIKILHGVFPNAQLLVSTSAPRGVDDYFEDLFELARDISTVGLQFSVHESTDEARKKLIPSPTSTLKQISEYGAEFFLMSGRSPFFNYCVHEENNTSEDVDRLLAHFDPVVWQATLSVICEQDESIAEANERQRELAEGFSAKMLSAGYSTRVFNPSGQSFGGGCGQLFATQQWMAKHPELAKQSKGKGLDKIHMPK